ncbi:3-oxo-5-alpha-steroid 4-dehydrogenase, putative [Trypanosoma equiperdum]|uniref:Putative enoyl-CoA reductase n=3 Tax=Trypanozoon TaxID=39700 RepID=ENCR_TRYB2|nr:3-oxo-5-alpha-steroid 4-dehydrogenase, putative [Trypanosoma brucei gambiense DAL972]XP_843778.1 3-oxo-5-alpha-steroid 4-dehydrogenase, putative [Trypanosoma brucei brucei TREU927]AAX80213.1 3-oxo-5-alpha-steroid 4-dehydrogenase, putative [Trypanosoma brucei]SCU72129.1 3-oxo-5-alpha-steroid 4-dehydrogenase, putative [Trypanosoma equiperdum]AAZ10219.1 3-oxo-5-alpha-steroid 4-dehydrogenase, putative [Trypanosoma brucei brucei TREU927]CBH09831.1 3-oxo-5-alpha-steroid 4-dehydrogenase, putative |eukprot:XP_011772124.1 3-oxo-5-alpha-steroid 4-dehydrogenase, putative [Trypanosoma brucei gambiense DAL972]
MKVTVISGSSSEVVELPSNAGLTDLKKVYKPRVDIHRKSFKILRSGGDKNDKSAYITLDAKRALTEQGVKDGSEVVYKDLGPQVGYRTVFVVEYAGPLAIMLAYAARPSFIYGSSIVKEYCYTQKLYIALFCAHFIKRELETFFVHKFSHPTMPRRNIIKNCVYYWTFALGIGYALCSPYYTEPASPTLVNASAVAMVIFELLNFAVHVQLSGMRKGDGDATRPVPKGILFSLVSCPNYLFEILSWVAFSLGTSMLTSWGFTFAGLVQMAEWAVKKHKNYIKTDPSVRNKKAMLPFLL